MKFLARLTVFALTAPAYAIAYRAPEIDLAIAFQVSALACGLALLLKPKKI